MTTFARLTGHYTESIVRLVQGKELRAVRQKLGLTQEGFAERLGVTANSVARWERGEMPINRLVDNFARLLKRTDAPTLRAKRKK